MDRRLFDVRVRGPAGVCPGQLRLSFSGPGCRYAPGEHEEETPGAGAGQPGRGVRPARYGQQRDLRDEAPGAPPGRSIGA